jgi:hypothetical protein
MEYKDRAWCSLFYQGICVNDKCFRALNQEERCKATKWWGSSSFPFSLEEMKTEDCGYIKNSIMGTLEYAVSDKETKND